MGSRGSEIVAGIDFGTTHSGVSWAINGGSKNIRLINNWPDPGAQNASKEKVPSSISYSNGQPQSWGYTVGLNEESFRWIKILLEENHKYATTVEPVKNSNTLLRKVEKTAQDVVADYLKLLWTYTIEDIRKHHPDYEEIFVLRVILTVPAIWSPAAKDRTLQAAKKAGMPEDIQLVTEPEAAALATLKEKADENLLKVGEAFVVVDAGGGTVDLISYEVLGLTPLRLKECAIGSGMLQQFVDDDATFTFAKHIETLVGAPQYRSIKESNRKRMMKDFEFGIKRCFSGSNDPVFSVDLRGVEDDPKNGIVDDTITLNPATLATCFDQVAQRIQKLVADQIADVEERNLSVKAVLLVGGFGESPYLYKRLKACYKTSGIEIMGVRGAFVFTHPMKKITQGTVTDKTRWSSVCRGATLWGLEHPNSDASVAGSHFSHEPSIHNQAPTITSRLSRYSYGMVHNKPYDPSKHLSHEMYRDAKTGRDMARDQMTWLLERVSTLSFLPTAPSFSPLPILGTVAKTMGEGPRMQQMLTTKAG
ncbi:MAG: hypothetical protein Q9225_007610 [Loekoesia sp. 1 TL-2023]